MAKGFGFQANKTLGYALVILPQVNGYVSKTVSDDGVEDEYIDITNVLEIARLWKTKKQAEKAVGQYLGYLLKEYDKGNLPEMKVIIRAISKDKNGTLQEKEVDVLKITVTGVDPRTRMNQK